MRQSTQMQVYGAWLYKGEWDCMTTPPLDDWKLLTMRPGRYTEPPAGMAPRKGQVLLLMQGETAIVIIP